MKIKNALLNAILSICTCTCLTLVISSIWIYNGTVGISGLYDKMSWYLFFLPYEAACIVVILILLFIKHNLSKKS